MSVGQLYVKFVIDLQDKSTVRREFNERLALVKDGSET